MKSYTDLKQSKKLAEILPLKSADMRYHTISHHNPYPCDEIVYTVDFSKPVDIDIPCWSLAALLDVFPNSEQKRVDICHGGWKGEEYVSDWFCSYDDYEKNYFETTNSDNPVDACVEMIIKLKSEQGL